MQKTTTRTVPLLRNLSTYSDRRKALRRPGLRRFLAAFCFWARPPQQRHDGRRDSSRGVFGAFRRKSFRGAALRPLNTSKGA